MLLELIQHDRAEILERSWRRLRDENPGRQKEEVMSGLDEFLDELAEAYAREQGHPGGRTSPFDEAASSPEHGRQRKRAGYEAWRLVLDYGAVCDGLTSAAAARGLAVPAEEFYLLNRSIDMAAARAIDSYCSEAEREREVTQAARLGGLAHELRNALQSASAGFTILRRNQVGTQSRTADAVERALGRMDQLIQRALATAHHASGAGLRRARVSAAEIVEAVVGALAPEQGARVEAKADPTLVLDVDPVLMESALGNLVQNAVKFTIPPGSVSVRGRREGDRALFEVEDHCGGLPPAVDVERLFRPFVQCADDHRGVGLGLAVARRAVEEHGGRITVRDLPTQGCVFTIELPVAPEQD